MNIKTKAGAFLITLVLVFALFAPSLAGAQTATQATNTSPDLSNIDYVHATAHDLLTGKISTIPGGIDTTNQTSKYKPSISPKLGPSLPTNSGGVSPMTAQAIDISAGYQVYGEVNNIYTGEVSAETNTISNLANSFAEYAVIHTWAAQSGRPGNNENAICIGHNGNTPSFGVQIAQLGNYVDGTYQDWWSGTGSATDTYYIQVYPQITAGSRNYNKITVLIWDLTNNNYFSKQYPLPNTESIACVDGALEQPVNNGPNSKWFYFTQFVAEDQNFNQVNLLSVFQWKEWHFSQMQNVHSESYSSPGVTNGQVTLGQEKTP